MQVREIMSGRVCTVDPNSTIRDAAAIMRDEKLGALPVRDGDRIIGMVTDRDVAVRGIATGRPPGNVSVRDVMSEGVYTVRADAPVETAEELMAKHQVRRIPVTDAEDCVVGMITVADLAKAGQRELAEDAVEGIVQPTDAPRRT